MGDIDEGRGGVAPNERLERLDDGGYRIDTGNGGCGLRDDGAEPRGGAAPVGQAVDVGRQDPPGAPRRSRTPGAGAGEELPAGPSRPCGVDRKSVVQGQSVKSGVHGMRQKTAYEILA